MYLTGQASRFFFCFPLLPRVVPPLPPLSPALPSLKRPSCPVAQHACLTWYFTGWAPVRVRACIWGLASHTEFGWVSLSSSGPVLLSIIPPQQSQGQPLIPPCPISDSVGAPDSSHHRPNRPPLLSANFLIYACKLYIFSSVKAGTQSLLGMHFLRSWCWVFCARA